MKQLLKNNTILLYAGMLTNVVLGYAVTKFNTAFLSVESFGILNLFINILLFSRVFFSAGVFESSTRLLAVEKDEHRISELFGSTILLALTLGIILSAAVGISSFFIDELLQIKTAFLLRLFWPLSFILLLQNMLQIVLRGMGRIRLLSLYFFAGRLIYLLMLGALWYFDRYGLINVSISYLLSIGLAVLLFSFLPGPSFKQARTHIQTIWREVREYGRHLYAANLFTAFFYHSDKLLLAYFLDARQLGYYALAFTLSVPIPYFSNALSTSAFRGFARETGIPKRKLHINLAYVTVATTLLLVFNRFIVETLFSADFAPARPAFIILTLAFAVNALSVPYTMYFKAQKRGKEIRNITLASQILFLAANVTLIPLLGISGAAWSALLAYGLDCTLYLMAYYRKAVN